MPSHKNERNAAEKNTAVSVSVCVCVCVCVSVGGYMCVDACNRD